MERKPITKEEAYIFGVFFYSGYVYVDDLWDIAYVGYTFGDNPRGGLNWFTKILQDLYYSNFSHNHRHDGTYYFDDSKLPEENQKYIRERYDYYFNLKNEDGNGPYIHPEIINLPIDYRKEFLEAYVFSSNTCTFVFLEDDTNAEEDILNLIKGIYDYEITTNEFKKTITLKMLPR